MNRDKLSENFWRDEFGCNCGCGCDTVDAQLLTILQLLRDNYGRVHITSGFRCPEYNEAIGGASKSQHMYGRAADISLPDANDLEEVATFAAACGATVMLYEDWMHIDTRSGLTFYKDMRKGGRS